MTAAIPQGAPVYGTIIRCVQLCEQRPANRQVYFWSTLNTSGEKSMYSTLGGVEMWTRL